MRGLLVVLSLFCLAVPAYAQVSPAASYDLKIYPAGSSTAQTRSVPEAAVLCAQVTGPTGIRLNPTTWFWPDPARAGQWCKVDDASRFNALADGDYEGTVTPVNVQGTRGPESTPRAPFRRERLLPPPAAVPGVQISN